MRLPHATAPFVAAAVLVLSACNAGGAPTPPIPGSTDPTTAGIPSASDLAGPGLPVGSAFSSAIWSLTLPETSQQKTPIVAGDRVVVLDGDSVRAVDPQGKDAWTTPFPAFTADQRIHDVNGYPFLRLAEPGVAAVVDAGKQAGNGLDEDIYAVKVTLVDVEAGTVIKAVTLPGTGSDSPKPGKVGLAFALGREMSAVLPSGKVVKVPANTTAGGTLHQVTGGATVGNNIISAWDTVDTQSVNRQTTPGFAGQRWDSISTAPNADYTTADVEASDADHLIVGRWVVPGSGPTSAVVQVQVIDAQSGEVLSSPPCETDPTASALTASPNRQHFVDGPMRLDSSGHAECIGGGENQKKVGLTAVTDDGRAFGRASDLLVDVAPDGTAKTTPLPDGAQPPIGIMTGNLAVHWDPTTAILTGNPIP